MSSSGNEFQIVRAHNRKSPGAAAVGVESTARNDELMSVGGAQTKTRSDFGSTEAGMR